MNQNWKRRFLRTQDSFNSLPKYALKKTFYASCIISYQNISPYFVTIINIFVTPVLAGSIPSLPPFIFTINFSFYEDDYKPHCVLPFIIMLFNINT